MTNNEQLNYQVPSRPVLGYWLVAALFCYCAALTTNAYAQVVIPGAGIINTMAGNGTAAYSGDGGAATSAELNSPLGVTVDSAGNIYITDTQNNRIRKVTASTGVITTVAGGGTSGTGDGGAATSAELGSPEGPVALDAAGNVYIPDTHNFRIRKVTVSTGIITTVAGDGFEGDFGDGGPATSAGIGLPTGVALDSAGNIYIVDEEFCLIRKVTASTGIISTIAGTRGQFGPICGYSGDSGAATSMSLQLPAAMALDSSGNIFISDAGNNRILKDTVSTGVITTVAGNTTPGYTGDGGAATSAELYNPVGLALDRAGNIYLADKQNFRVRKVMTSTGIITTVAGNGVDAFAGDGSPAINAEISPIGLALDAVGNIYIADGLNNRIRVVGVSQQLSNFDQITTGWFLCTGPACAGGTGNPTSTTQNFGNSSPSLDSSSMLLAESGPAASNNGWYRKTGADDAATAFTLGLQFNVPSNTDVQALEFDQYQYIQAPHGGVTSNTRLFFGTECINGGTWQV